MKSKYLPAVLLLCLVSVGVYQLGSSLKIVSKAWLSQYLIEQAWSRTLAGADKVQPWPWADTWPVAELTMPKLDISQLVLAGDSGRVLAFAPGMSHYLDEGRSMDMTFVSGHRDTHFRFLKDVEVEDMFTLKLADGQLQHYRVIDTQVVNENWRVPEHVASERSLLILATCYPFDALSFGADKRLLVFARELAVDNV